ncbi:hypothetical protein DERP_004876 [Dermatophagoides pteronyssinus]|uniref:Uncharacterized protein n=1 Tax=Dermatophagoides pteronyssinus TaxID=6956 RepID=A0ABQ8JSS6_DERPT|nr:hypothetical protein DERP_004876 [Dermatophagoides pteronyssinus]
MVDLTNLSGDRRGGGGDGRKKISSHGQSGICAIWFGLIGRCLSDMATVIEADSGHIVQSEWLAMFD